MFLAPAAMFSMFFFLSQYIQNVMGYSPIKTGVAFLPFCVAGAAVSVTSPSKRWPTAVSTVMTFQPFCASRLTEISNAFL